MMTSNDKQNVESKPPVHLDEFMSKKMANCREFLLTIPVVKNNKESMEAMESVFSQRKSVLGIKPVPPHIVLRHRLELLMKEYGDNASAITKVMCDAFKIDPSQVDGPTVERFLRYVTMFISCVKDSSRWPIDPQYVAAIQAREEAARKQKETEKEIAENKKRKRAEMLEQDRKMAQKVKDERKEARKKQKLEKEPKAEKKSKAKKPAAKRKTLKIKQDDEEEDVDPGVAMETSPEDLEEELRLAQEQMDEEAREALKQSHIAASEDDNEEADKKEQEESNDSTMREEEASVRHIHLLLTNSHLTLLCF